MTESMTQQDFKYFAFISYNSRDTEWGKRVQRKLEHYRMPATLCSEHGWSRTPIKPVFFAPTDIQPGGLSEELQERLRASKNLIVICSPNSAKSEWVGKEIAFFHQLGRTKQIHFFIVEGEPHSGNPDTECFNPIVDTLGLPEILGANIHEKIYRWPWMNRERAYVQLVSKLLDVEFDAIWQRHKRLLRQKLMAWAVGILLVIAALVGVWVNSQPVDVELQLNEASVHNPDLPPLKDAVVTLTFDNETKSDTVSSLDVRAAFTNIPHRFMNNKVRVRVESQNFLPTDTVVLLTKENVVNVYRNPDVFGNVRFRLWNIATERTAAQTDVAVDGRPAISNTDGYVQLSIPLSEQKVSYPVASQSVKIVSRSINMPCGPDDVVLFENN